MPVLPRESNRQGNHARLTDEKLEIVFQFSDCAPSQLLPVRSGAVIAPAIYCHYVTASMHPSAPAKQIDPRLAFRVLPFLIPDLNIPNFACPTAKRDRWSVPTGANDRADWQNLIATVAEMNNYSFEADSAPGDAQLKRGERAPVVDVDLVVIRPSVYVSVA